jgi:hypothetical protein
LRTIVGESMQISGARSKADAGIASGAARDLRLSDGPVFQIRDDVDDRQWIFGGQYLSVPANSRIDVDLEFELMGEDGRVEVQHGLKSGQVNYFVKRIPDVQPGDRLRIRYSYSTAEPLEGLGTYLVVTRGAGSGLSLRLPRARLQIHPESGSSTPPLVVHQFEIEPAPGLADSGRAARPR